MVIDILAWPTSGPYILTQNNCQIETVTLHNQVDIKISDCFEQAILCCFGSLPFVMISVNQSPTVRNEKDQHLSKNLSIKKCKKPNQLIHTV